MTSSLVGSEMCIRDRDHCDQCDLGTQEHSDLVTAIQGGWITLFVRSVSYTHLTLPTICSV
eukprot:3127319-Prorocentrum_lima.AAC.1